MLICVGFKFLLFFFFVMFVVLLFYKCYIFLIQIPANFGMFQYRFFFFFKCVIVVDNCDNNGTINICKW